MHKRLMDRKDTFIRVLIIFGIGSGAIVCIGLVCMGIYLAHWSNAKSKGETKFSSSAQSRCPEIERDGDYRGSVEIDPLGGPEVPIMSRDERNEKSTEIARSAETGQRVISLDLRNVAALRMAKKLWSKQRRSTRIALIRNMGKADTPACVAWLKEIMDGNGPEERANDIRAHAISAISKMENEDARRYFFALDRHPEERIRVFFATTLGYLRDKESREELEYLARADTSIKVRKAAETSIRKREDSRNK